MHCPAEAELTRVVLPIHELKALDYAITHAPHARIIHSVAVEDEALEVAARRLVCQVVFKHFHRLERKLVLADVEVNDCCALGLKQLNNFYEESVTDATILQRQPLKMIVAL